MEEENKRTRERKKEERERREREKDIEVLQMIFRLPKIHFIFWFNSKKHLVQLFTIYSYTYFHFYA